MTVKPKKQKKYWAVLRNRYLLLYKHKEGESLLFGQEDPNILPLEYYFGKFLQLPTKNGQRQSAILLRRANGASDETDEYLITSADEALLAEEWFFFLE